jgi:biotin carboxylase
LKKRILILLPTTTYRAEPFFEAARRLGVEVLVGSDRCHELARIWPIQTLPLDLRQPEEAAAQIVTAVEQRPVDAILPVDDGATLVAAAAAERLGLPHNSVRSVEAARNKFLMRRSLRSADVLSPRFELVSVGDDVEALARSARYPCVLKPLLLSGSRGVIRADEPAGFAMAFRRIRALLSQPDVAHGAGSWASRILMEDFIPGREVALEGLLVGGALRVLALFDKPDPLDGPFFEETLYVTPSNCSPSVQAQIAESAERAARGLGLRHGPIHAELRLNTQGVWIVEVAARSIGGRCSQILRFGVGVSLEELILRHMLGLPVAELERERRSAGVMMIPIPEGGMLRGVHGVEDATAVSGIEGVEISVKAGERVVPLPEGASYLGFIFAKAETPALVEAALRQAHGRLHFEIEPELPLAWSCSRPALPGDTPRGPAPTRRLRAEPG